MDLVSEEVKNEAMKYAITHAISTTHCQSLYKAFIAGAAYMKPIEHEQKPTNGYEEK